MRRALRRASSLVSSQERPIAETASPATPTLEVPDPESPDARASGRYWDEWVSGTLEDQPPYWMSIPKVRAEVNRRATGDPHAEYFLHFIETALPALAELPLPRALSIGCGTGGVERALAAAHAVTLMVGVDLSEASLQVAKDAAKADGLADRLRYEHDSVDAFLARQEPESASLIVYHGVLHHLENLEAVVSATRRALRRGGLVYAFEYVGPSREQWRASSGELLEVANRLFSRVPARWRRTPAVWPPVAMADPTEMIRSDEIDPILRDQFEIVSYWPLYGNVLCPLTNALRAAALEDDVVVQGILDEAILVERELEGTSLQPLFAIYLLRRAD
jgi:SAM-dependent methyltransferase